MSKKPYKAITIAKYFLLLAEESGEFVSPMKLQKLIYFAHGWHLAIKKSPLINENIEAWRYGPVIPSVYHEFKKFRGNPITSQAGFCEDEDVDDLDMFTKALLEKIWNIYSHLTAMDLSRITHLPESPWFQAKSSDSKTDAISDSLIMSHFESELKLTN